MTWTGLWLRRPDAVVRFDLADRPSRSGTDLTWILLVEPPEPDPPLLGHMGKRLNQIINAHLRFSFGQ
ncbi:hypothetical protein J2S58_002135 [Nakamurella flavida]|uniref:hypothetical protein n=1 Tax=Nakamurella flavida TaxID=363630 RepID=UPI002784262C|nr:hypothetical protein [Nakamurella flavida]MDP9778512.1 hypothetical protein [Nakamurella flavida]